MDVTSAEEFGQWIKDISMFVTTIPVYCRNADVPCSDLAIITVHERACAKVNGLVDDCLVYETTGDTGVIEYLGNNNNSTPWLAVPVNLIQTPGAEKDKFIIQVTDGGISKEHQVVVNWNNETTAPVNLPMNLGELH
jgi:hypothetical protein